MKINEITHNDVWYHGSPKQIKKLDSEFLGTGSGSSDAKYGFYFSQSKQTALAYMEEYKNPKGQVQMDIELLRSDIKNIKLEVENGQRDWQRARMAINSIYKKIDNLEDSAESVYYGTLLTVKLAVSDTYVIDAQGRAWDDNYQKNIIKKALLNGYDSVIFKNMQDSGWFGGAGEDNIAVVFDTNNVSVVSIEHEAQ